MSRLFALLAVAVIAFLCAPHPVKLAPSVGPVEEAEPVSIVPEEPENPGLANINDFLPDPERVARAVLEEIITADNLDPPRPVPLLAMEFTPDGQLVLVAREPDALPGPQPPAWVRSRLSGFKERELREFGGSSESERGTALALAWLARQQKQDGGWEFDGTDKGARVAATGLVLLTYLGVGEIHKRDWEEIPRPRRGCGSVFCTCVVDGTGEGLLVWAPPGPPRPESKYQKTVAAGLGFLQKNCPPSGPNAGRMSTNMTEQAVATLALCEAYGVTRDPTLRPYALAAAFYLQKKQAANGGWSDNPDGPGDIAVTGWAVQALFAAHLSNDLAYDNRVIKKAIKFLDFVSAGARKSRYGITDNLTAKPGTTATATGLLCRYHIDRWGPSHPGMIDGVVELAKNPPSAANSDPLFLYYATWVMARYEGEDWKNWNEGPKDPDGTRKDGLRDLLVGSQNRKDGANLGSWDPHPGEFGSRYGRLGTTALNLLTLEVYYRYPQLYKRGENGNAVMILEDK